MTDETMRAECTSSNWETLADGTLRCADCKRDFGKPTQYKKSGSFLAPHGILVGHLHSNGDFCQDFALDVTHYKWPVALYAVANELSQPSKAHRTIGGFLNVSGQKGLRHIETNIDHPRGAGIHIASGKDEALLNAIVETVNAALTGPKPEPVGYFLRAGYSATSDGTKLWEQVADEHKSDADVVPLYAALLSAPGDERDATVRRLINELRWYNPAADAYKGEHIHKLWARELEDAMKESK